MMLLLNQKARPTERQEQAALISWWAIACNRYKLHADALFSVPNGSHLAGDAQRRAIQVRNLKATGLRPGVPDLFLAVPIRNDKTIMIAAGLFIELKRKPNKPSEDQLAMADMLRGAGYDVVIAYSSDEAIRAVTGYLNGQPTNGSK